MVRRAYTALSSGDMDAFTELSSPDFVADFSRRLVDPFVLRGRDEAVSFFLDQSAEIWDGWPAWDPQQLIDGGDQVVAFIRFSATGRGSGAAVEVYVANLLTFGDDGKLIEMKYFGEDSAGALKAAGLPE